MDNLTDITTTVTTILIPRGRKTAISDRNYIIHPEIVNKMNGVFMLAHLEKDVRLKRNWRSIEPSDLEAVKKILSIKHGSLTNAARNLSVRYDSFSAVLCGRLQLFGIVEAIQDDLELSNSDVLNLWPLLGTWPKNSRRVG